MISIRTLTQIGCFVGACAVMPAQTPVAPPAPASPRTIGRPAPAPAAVPAPPAGMHRLLAPAAIIDFADIADQVRAIDVQELAAQAKAAVVNIDVDALKEQARVAAAMSIDVDQIREQARAAVANIDVEAIREQAEEARAKAEAFRDN